MHIFFSSTCTVSFFSFIARPFFLLSCFSGSVAAGLKNYWIGLGLKEGVVRFLAEKFRKEGERAKDSCRLSGWLLVFNSRRVALCSSWSSRSFARPGLGWNTAQRVFVS